jgi:RNA polymerase sigma factor (sigma-70 family)
MRDCAKPGNRFGCAGEWGGMGNDAVSLAICGPGGVFGQEAARARPGVMSQALEHRLAAAMAAGQRGDRLAYDHLLHGCVVVIAAVARRQGVPAALVDDVVQESLLTLHQIRHSWDPARAFLPWLRAIAARRAVDCLRRHGRQGGREVHDPILYEAAEDPGEDAAQSVARADDGARLVAAIATLPEGQREAVEQLVIADLSLREAAAATGRSEGALKVNLHRAIKGLRGRMLGGGADG